ncbi:hypothetical protein WA158_002066 [Blastocystis sp. Blastoise]
MLVSFTRRVLRSNYYYIFIYHLDTQPFARSIYDTIPDGYKLGHGDRSPLYNYYVDPKQKEEEDETWKNLVPCPQELINEFPHNTVIANLNELRDINRCVGRYQPSEADESIGMEDGIYGQLSYVGMDQMRGVGKVILARYKDEIEELQAKNIDIPVTGTVARRTQLSAFCVLEELYKGKNLHIPPVYISNKECCILNRYNPSLKKLTVKRLQQPDFKQLEESHKIPPELVTYIQKHTNYIYRDVVEYARLYDYINTHQKHNLPIDPKIKGLYGNSHFFMMQKYMFLHTTPDIFVQTSSPLATFLYNNINKNYMSNIQIFSAHDTTLLSLLYMLSPQSALEMPPYGSYIAIEYYVPVEKNSTLPPVITMVYNNKRVPIYVYGEEKYQFCPLRIFRRILSFKPHMLEALNTMREDYLQDLLTIIPPSA